MAKAKVFERSDGTLTLKTGKIRRVDLYLYWFDGGGGPELIDATCAAAPASTSAKTTSPSVTPPSSRTYGFERSGTAGSARPIWQAPR